VPNAHHEPLTALDAWFLYAERPEAPLHIGGVYIFEGGSEVEGGRGALGIAETVAERLHLVPRYRQKVMWTPFNLTHPVWVDDPDFDLSYHVRRAALPRPGDDAALREYAGRVFARQLDLRKPLWELYVVEGLEAGRVAMINKVHHAMVDGVSTVDIGTLLFDMDPQGAAIEAPKRAWRPRPSPHPRTLIAETVRSLNPLPPLRNLSPGRLKAAADAVLRSPVAGAASLAFSLVKPNRQLFFNRPIGPHRRVGHATMPLQLLKDVKNAFGGSVNDVVLAVVAGALRRWLTERGDAVPETIRVFCPVSVRDADARYKLGNKVSGMVVELPLGQMPPLDRLSRISAHTGDLKRSRQAVAAQTLSQLTDWAPATLHALGGRVLTAQPAWGGQALVNLVVTNVPGPQVPFYTGGARMLEVWPFVPTYHSLGLNIALFSYDGSLFWGLMADRDLVTDLNRFETALEKTAREYAKLAGTVTGGPVRLEARAAAARPASRPRARARVRDTSAD
jgi:diacylglycerol O-acyltransferase / wax synthase